MSPEFITSPPFLSLHHGAISFYRVTSPCGSARWILTCMTIRRSQSRWRLRRSCHLWHIVWWCWCKRPILYCIFGILPSLLKWRRWIQSQLINVSAPTTTIIGNYCIRQWASDFLNLYWYPLIRSMISLASAKSFTCKSRLMVCLLVFGRGFT